ncbi:hypothetical protein PTKIN_Ptkin07bG0285200 [Pterospermum kingtungense]
MCPLCEVKEETIGHLFLECNAARAVWFESSLSLRIKQFKAYNLIQWSSDWLSKTDLSEPQALWFYG